MSGAPPEKKNHEHPLHPDHDRGQRYTGQLAALFGTLAAALTWLVSRSLGRRLQPGVVAALWSVVLIKFLVPAGPDLPYSLHSAFDALSSYSLTAQGLLDTGWSTTPSAARLARAEPSGNRQADRSGSRWWPGST
jgi:hypothetical protein